MPTTSYPPRWRRRWRAWRRRSSFAWWATAAALAIVTGTVVRAAMLRSSALLDELGPMREVAVVVAPVDAGEVVDGEDLALARRPSTMMPDGAVVDLDDVDAPSGRVALVPLVPGEVLVASKLAPAGLRGAAALLPDGMRALAVPAGPAGRPPVSVGDHVDVLVTLGAGDGSTVVVAEAAVVVALDDESDAVTVAVSPDDAPAVASAITAGTVTLALSGRGPAR